MRRFSTHALVWSALGLSLAGCEPHQSWLRQKDDDAASSDKDTSKIPAVDSDSKNPQPFFKSNRLLGGWSSEARSIERDLGVNN
ncbi:MAG TPA: hypothetical protein VKA15_01130 [Isosphaeraceae bacterium]|nr:hypothetical protein [Isosphaeraceae bacterium]